MLERVAEQKQNEGSITARVVVLRHVVRLAEYLFRGTVSKLKTG